MNSIINISNLKKEIGDNIPSEYLPVKTNYNECNWDMVAGYFISFAYGLELKNYSKQEFEADCYDVFKSKQVSDKHFQAIHRAYFEEGNYLKLGPSCLLLHTQTDESINSKVYSASKKVAISLLTLFGRESLTIPNKESDHFISEIITSTLKNKLQKSKIDNKASTYLPFLQEKFLHDFKFLASKPAYMLEHIASFLALYNFLHISQLALNLADWKCGAPKSKQLYFVIETEKVSAERTKVKERGWNLFHSSCQNLFPILSTLGLLQQEGSSAPLWRIYGELNEAEDQCEYINSINDYCKRFIEARNLKKEFNQAASIEDSITQLFDLAIAQFNKIFADSSATRYQANSKVTNALKEHTAKGIVKPIGRVGNTLVLTQDNLLLLTNVVIGDKQKLRLNDLIEEFRLRGIYFDETSEEWLVGFYERIGNVERMSDSGDDLYVRQTV
ncbi:DNA phosphorothioation-dependent restriction protein DptG [Vibrio kyushuensis]|uniref:DNA phosphorothioation-dependent restriction protein DptG n=1 Tax=Vibrio kyushuensis TaxID=2910249 RepID=UPI003D14E053